MSRLRMPRMPAHGTSPRLARVSSDSWPAASPMISRQRTSAWSKSRLSSTSSRDELLANSSASAAASRMCSSRIRSRGCVEHLCLRHHLLPETLTQVARCSEVNACMKNLREFDFEGSQPNQTDPYAGLELDEQVQVTLGPGFAMQHGTKQREPAHPMLLAEVSDCFHVAQPRVHGEMVHQRRPRPATGSSRQNAAETTSGYAGCTYPRAATPMPRGRKRACETHDRTQPGFAG